MVGRACAALSLMASAPDTGNTTVPAHYGTPQHQARRLVLPAGEIRSSGQSSR